MTAKTRSRKSAKGPQFALMIHKYRAILQLRPIAVAQGWADRYLAGFARESAGSEFRAMFLPIDAARTLAEQERVGCNLRSEIWLSPGDHNENYAEALGEAEAVKLLLNGFSGNDGFSVHVRHRPDLGHCRVTCSLEPPDVGYPGQLTPEFVLATLRAKLDEVSKALEASRR